MTAAEATANFPELLDRVVKDRERVVVERDGERLVAIVPIEDLEELEAWEALEEAKDIEAIKEALAEQGDRPNIPWEEVKAELDALRAAEEAAEGR